MANKRYKIYLLVLWTMFDVIQAREGPPLLLPQPQHHIYYYPNADPGPRLSCRADGSAPIRFSWEKDRSPVDIQEFTVPNADGVFSLDFNIQKSPPRDQSKYACYVNNDYGLVMSEYVTVTLAFLTDHPKMNDSYKESATVDSPYTLPCELPSALPTPSVEWIRTSTDAASRPVRLLYNDRITSDFEGNLHFLYTDLADEGEYRCKVSNTLLGKYTYGPTFRLKAKDDGPQGSQAHHIWNSDTNLVVLYGTDVTLRCIFGGRPLPNIKWNTLENGDVKAPKAGKVDDYGRNFVIKNLTFTDAGTYECVTTGKGGTLGTNFNVEVHSSPTWISTPTPVTAYAGEQVTFSCSAAGVPEPTLMWFIDAYGVKDLQGHRKPTRIQNDQLTGSASSVIFFTAEASFTVECLAYNQHASIATFAYLYVTGTAPGTQTTVSPPPKTTVLPQTSAPAPYVIGIAVGVAGVVVLVIVIAAYCICSRRRHREPAPKPNVSMAYRNNAFSVDEKPRPPPEQKRETYSGLNVDKVKQQPNIYDELGGASNAVGTQNEETEYCYISDSDIMAAQKASKNPPPPVRSNRSIPTPNTASSSMTHPSKSPSVASNKSVGYKIANNSGKVSHFPSGKYSSLDDPVYRGQEGSDDPAYRGLQGIPTTQPTAEYEEPIQSQNYFILEPELTNV